MSRAVYVEGRWGVALSGYKDSFGDDGSVLKFDYGDGSIPL